MFEAAEQEYLIRAYRENNVVLFLGAGASYGSETSTGEAIPLGKNLSSFFREMIGETDESLRLDQLGKDVRRFYGEEGLRKKLEEKFMETRPSQDLIDLFSFSWNRCYTLNYDDTIEGVPRKGRVQRHRYYSGTDKVEESRGANDLQIVHLNGSILKYEKGIVLTDKEFRSGIRKRNPWYEKCASDFASKTFIFVGTELDEPIFKAYVEELEDVSTFAKSFLLTPGVIADRDNVELQDLNIVHKQSTLSDLVQWLRRNKAKFDSDSATLNEALVEVGSPIWVSGNIDKSAFASSQLKRSFYSGVYPTWQCVASDWPAPISIISSCLNEIKDFQRAASKGLCIVVGQAGSGKTTSIMSSLYALSKEGSCRVFEFKGDGLDDLDVALRGLNPSEWSGSSCIIWVPDIQIYADEIEKISRLCKSSGCIIVGELRSSDWSGRFFRKHRFADKLIEIGRLKPADYDVLAQAIQDFAIAPEFRKLSRQAQVDQLKRSKDQLLILMLEATKQRPFEEIIENEYFSIDDAEARAFLCIVALITMTRSRLSISDYHAITSQFGLRSSLSVCLTQLEGIVQISGQGKLIGRHESYLNHVISATADLDTIFDACLAIFRSFTIYEVPFVVNAGKVKGNILKFMMRGQFLMQVLRDSRELVSRLYEELEYDYQSDGHYWLQRGKFCRSMGGIDNQETALRFLKRSVEAYDNSYSRHSLAQQKLIYCSMFKTSTPYLEALMAEGVAELKTQAITRVDAEDEYPLVALANSHPKALIAWGRGEDAKRVCREYHAQLSQMDKQMPFEDREVRDALRFCLSVAST
ncbi:P-loop NTPase [Chachezhania sediminis]|uniref:P-loop NTPase n=1 Tax=Chachezhania sediminis TaxID=2599291 RepID=UPI00131ADB68|nr:SIR2 family protein [Chachezhania sediminis]